MHSALIVSSSETGRAFFCDFLAQSGWETVDTAATGGQTRRLLIDREYDLCIVNAPLRDESGLALARSITQQGISQVILVVRAQQYDEVCDKVEDAGVFTLGKPVNRLLLWNLLRLCTAAHNKLLAMRRENGELLRQLEDIRAVGRAKCVLIERLGMTETEAHRLIEKQAMDRRVTRREVAQELLRTYDG